MLYLHIHSNMLLLLAILLPGILSAPTHYPSMTMHQSTEFWKVKKNDNETVDSTSTSLDEVPEGSTFDLATDVFETLPTYSAQVFFNNGKDGTKTITGASNENKTPKIYLNGQAYMTKVTTPQIPDEIWNFLPDSSDFNYFGDENYTAVTTNEIVIKIVEPFTAHRFFKENWLWCLIVILAILFLFCLPGMFIQIYCNKFYLAYRREKNKTIESKMEPTVDSEFDSTDTLDRNSLSENNAEHMEMQQVTNLFSPPVNDAENQVVQLTSQSQMAAPVTQPRNLLQSSSNQPVGTHSGYHASPQCETQFNSSPTQIQPPAGFVDPNKHIEAFPVRNAPFQNGNLSKLQHNIPVVVYSSQAVRTETMTNNPKTAIGDEKIIDSNKTKSSRKKRTRRRAQRNNKPPVRPPKPKQYKIRPPKPARLVKKESESESNDAVEEKSSKPKEAKPKGKLDKTVVDKSRGNNPSNKVESTERDQMRLNKKLKKVQGSELKELLRREELLRQIIQGINEAEVLQRKLDRTRKWTKEQKMRSEPQLRKEETNENSRHKSTSARKRRARHKQKERPPRYQDVVRDTSAKLRKQTKASRTRRKKSSNEEE